MDMMTSAIDMLANCDARLDLLTISDFEMLSNDEASAIFGFSLTIRSIPIYYKQFIRDVKEAVASEKQSLKISKIFQKSCYFSNC